MSNIKHSKCTGELPVQQKNAERGRHYHKENKQHTIFDHTATVRLEDLKPDHKAILTAMGEFMNTSVTNSLFHSTWCGIECIVIDAVGNRISGFTPAAIYEDRPDYLSTFDIYRIEMALLPFRSMDMIRRDMSRRE